MVQQQNCFAYELMMEQQRHQETQQVFASPSQALASACNSSDRPPLGVSALALACCVRLAVCLKLCFGPAVHHPLAWLLRL